MRVGLDVHVLTGPHQGTATVWANLLHVLPADFTYVLYSFDPQQTARLFPQSHFEHRAIPVHQAHARIFLAYPWLAARDRCEVFHTNYYAPLIGGGRRVVTVHDLVYIDFPEFAPGFRSLQQRVLGRWSAQRASEIIVDSAYAQSRVMHHFGIGPDRITVIYPGLGSVWQAPDQGEIARVWAGLSSRLPDRYLIGVGRLDPRKGVLAAAEVAQTLVQEGLTDALVWVGPNDFGATQIEAELRRRGLLTTVVRLTDLSTFELQAVYRHGQALLFPSLAEGFGYPPLESMSMGTPAIVSNRTSIPEVCGAGAIVVDPTDVRALCEAARSLTTASDTREKFVARGYERARYFTSERMAEHTVAVYQRAAAGQPA